MLGGEDTADRLAYCCEHFGTGNRVAVMTGTGSLDDSIRNR
jgi:hypothetical protein